MVEVRRPIFVSGENPALTLYTPETDNLTAIASYWQCELSPWGIGQVLILWLEKQNAATNEAGLGRIYTDNPPLARGLVQTLVQYFPEFQNIPMAEFSYMDAVLQHEFDGKVYRAASRAGDMRIEIEWHKPLDQKQIVWPGFPTGPAAFDLMTIICPCETAQVLVNGRPLDGEVRLSQTAEGVTGSSAFLAFSETWIGPFSAEDKRKTT
ncbi:MAG: hypothetical protein CVU39_15200 [Chloroflexi bacterium HGW-Chloroflexi-10]|nr:MAG: hypothetical protein CVU39_15200 [Chloroflexi bacterium HGW-Chloroflexi-10]